MCLGNAPRLLMCSRDREEALASLRRMGKYTVARAPHVVLLDTNLP